MKTSTYMNRPILARAASWSCHAQGFAGLVKDGVVSGRTAE
ncbi:MAG: hypothetical protein ACXWG1_04880 [Usitatibacter sp.]